MSYKMKGSSFYGKKVSCSPLASGENAKAMSEARLNMEKKRSIEMDNNEREDRKFEKSKKAGSKIVSLAGSIK